ncbi:MAG: glycosyltransferase [Chloroherpetonaceae bacterium]|nr:glycosyltransferase [Chloroherpetonaceae bacterium]
MSHQSSKTLKVLVVISVYPPYYVGGYELGCKEVVEHLRKRGHNVLVVTSTYGVGERVMEGGVWRVMVGFISERFDNKISYFWHLLRREIINRYYFFKAVREFEPDVIYLWAILHLSSSVMFWANETRRRVVYFISDKWMAEWKNESWYRLWNSSKASGVRKGIGKLLNIFGLAKVSEPKFQAVGFCSNYIRQVTLESGVRVENHEVIHWGVQVEQYGPSNKDAKKILFAGQCLPHKGIETAIRGIYHLKSKLGITDVVLTVAGGSLDKQYYERIRALARRVGIAE